MSRRRWRRCAVRFDDDQTIARTGLIAINRSRVAASRPRPAAYPRDRFARSDDVASRSSAAPPPVPTTTTP